MRLSKNKKGAKKKLGMQIVVWILAILMVAGSVVTVIASALTYSTSATYETTADEKIVRIGLLYGDSVVSAFQTRAPYGFKISSVDKNTNRSEEIYSLSATVLESAVDENLDIVNGDYVITDEKCDIGAYHAMLDYDLTLDQMYFAMNIALINGFQEDMIPSYSNGAYRLLLGSFGSYDEAQEFIDANPEAFEGFDIDGEAISEMSVSEPSETAVILINHDIGKAVFKYDGEDTHQLGLSAMESPEGETAYLQTPANKLYDGIFIFTRYKNGVQLVNLIGFEDYIKGVVPYEISNSWPLETQKAFAVCVRSYAVNKLARHMKTYGFDLCNTGCCQSYGGVRNVNDTVKEAVEATRGMVMVNDKDEIISTFYSAVSGGTTVNVSDAWGGSYNKDLIARPTPWEDYSGHVNGTWTWSVSPEELEDILKSKGFDEIKAPIEDIEVEYAENSGYVNKIIFTDERGNTAEIEDTDKVRTTLASYLKSSNFTVGQGKVTVNDPAFDSESAKTMFSRLTGKKISYIKWTDPMKVLTADGETYTWASVDTPILTGNNKVEYVDRSITLKADKKNDFLFVGRGWGHGVGISQVGAYNLGQQGFEYDFILNAYFPTAEIVELSMFTEDDAILADEEAVEEADDTSEEETDDTSEEETDDTSEEETDDTSEKETDDTSDSEYADTENNSLFEE